MRILILNWRDIRSPRGGGAERVTHEVARRLVESGHTVTWLSSVAAGLPAEDLIDGVRVVRRGSEASSRLHAPRFAREGFDVVVEGINTLPYLAPLWSRAPVVVFFHQLARDVWWYEAPLAVAVAGWIAEPLYLAVYRNVPAVTVSRSTRDDLRRFGLRNSIAVIPLAAAGSAIDAPPQKRLAGRLVAIGRLTPSKRFDHAIEAVAILEATLPGVRLDVVGDGRERTHLERLAARLAVEDRVTLHGRVEASFRDALLVDADAIIGTSVREGWGLTITEAARLGTPAVAYDIPGFRDSIVAGRTGILTSPCPAALASGVRRLVSDESAYTAIQRAAWSRARVLSWDKTAAAFEAALVAATSSAG